MQDSERVNGLGHCKEFTGKSATSKDGQGKHLEKWWVKLYSENTNRIWGPKHALMSRSSDTNTQIERASTSGNRTVWSSKYLKVNWIFLASPAVEITSWITTKQGQSLLQGLSRQTCGRFVFTTGQTNWTKRETPQFLVSTDYSKFDRISRGFGMDSSLGNSLFFLTMLDPASWSRRCKQTTLTNTWRARARRCMFGLKSLRDFLLQAVIYLPAL